MVLRNNIAANFISQFYIACIGVLFLPLYLKYMGAEAYGLVGFYALLQSLFNLLDLGFSAAIARESARFKGGALSAIMLRQLFRFLEIIFLAISVIGALLLILFSEFIAITWLNIENLAPDDVVFVVRVMAVILALRLISGLFRGVINGFERQVWMSGFNIFISTMRFVMVIPLFIYVGVSPSVYFKYQLAVGVLELTLLVLTVYRMLPKLGAPLSWALNLESVRPALKFSLTIGVLSTIWVMVTQVDKLLLSKLLSLSEYGYFTLVVMAASSILLASSPISTAILPRLSRLHAERKEEELIRLYRNSTLFVSLVSFPAAVILVFYSKQILLIWTGDHSFSNSAFMTLALYAAGNAIFGVAAFPYYLQYAKGDLKLHLFGSLLFLGLLASSIMWATSVYGMLGAGFAWVFSNLIYLLFWIPVVHRRLARGMHSKWILHDVVLPLAVSIIMGFSVFNLCPFRPDGPYSVYSLFFITLTVYILTLAAVFCLSRRFSIHEINIFRGM